MALGEKIALQLGEDHSDDLLCRWMSYYLAEKIAAARSACGSTRSALEGEIVDVILKLWAARRTFPPGTRPLEGFEPVIQLLSALADTNRFAKYFALQRDVGEKSLSKDETVSRRWLALADSVDDAARAIILFCLDAAIEHGKADAAQWLEFAEAVGAAHEEELPVVRFVIRASEAGPDDRQHVAERERLERLLAAVTAFETTAAVVASELRQKIGSLETDQATMPSAGGGAELA